MSVGGEEVVVAGRDPMLALALQRSGVGPVSEVTQAELLFATLDRCRPRVLVLHTDMEGRYDPASLVGNIAWLFPRLKVVLVRGAGAPEGLESPAGWEVFGCPPDYRRLAETVRRMLARDGAAGPAGCRAGGKDDPPPVSPAVEVPPAPQASPLQARAETPPPPPRPPGWAETASPATPSSGWWEGVSTRPQGVAGPASAVGTGRPWHRDRPAGAEPGAAPWGAAPAWAGVPQVVTVCSPKGGVGKTFVAVNLAVAVALRGREVALLDWDLASADVSIHLNLQAGPGILDLINSGREMSPETVRQHLVRHVPSGLYVLRGPTRPEMAEFVGHEHLRALLAGVRAAFPVVVIDTAPSPCDEALCQALEAATRILLVVGQDPACLYQAKVFLDLVPRLGINRGAVGLVVNRYREGVPDLAEIRSFLGLSPAALLPEDPAAHRAVLQGVPYVMRHTGPLATALLELGRSVLPGADGAWPPPEREARRGWLLRRGGGRARPRGEVVRWEGF